MKYLVILSLLFISITGQAQQRHVLKFRTITGTVTDNKGGPLTNGSVQFAGISMGSTLDAKGSFKLHLPDEPIMLTVYNRANDTKYYVMVNPDEQTLNIKLDKAATNASVKNFNAWSKNQAYNTNHTSQIYQSEEFYEYVHNGQRRVDNDVAIDGPVGYSPDVPQAVDTNKIYTAVEQAPKFGNVYTDWNKYLQTNLQFPDKARQNNIQGKVFVMFVVERDGRLTNIKVARSLTPECDKEAVRLVQSSPKWQPARYMGKAVRCQYSWPVSFIIPDKQ